jgi:two-component system alkaline phosphatase synthesis response regulator PhoP
MAKILVVDDDPDIQTALKSILEGSAYQVVAAYDGDEGLRKVMDEMPDLIILDVMMPRKHGFEVCRQLKTDPAYQSFAQIPVLMLTVYPDERQRIHRSIQKWDVAAEAYIQKPFDPQEVLDRVKQLLGE